ncbi:hypothetical protein A3K64_00345 [Candidatus Micrarchaeota archaeon RBG_16_36_9]|nr:MAG: hypothetical protein A3K64_00345 [Candidatus Micrarchaeota archaeon RBG_16_36_9]
MKGVEPLIAAIFIIMISIAGAIIVLQSSQPSVDRLKEISLFEESKKVLTQIDNAVRTVSEEGEGSTRVLQLSVSGGSYFVDTDRDAVVFSMDSRSQIVGIGVSNSEGNVNMFGEQNQVLLNISYSNINVTGGGNFGKGYHSLIIRNNGYDAVSGKQIISISFIPVTPITSFTVQYNQTQTITLRGANTTSPNNLNDLGSNYYSVTEGLESGGQYNYFQDNTLNITGFNTTSSDYTESLDNQNYNVTSTIGSVGSNLINQYNQDDLPLITTGTNVGGTAQNLDDLGINSYDVQEGSSDNIGMLAYGEGTVQTPRYRIWDSSSQTWGSEYSANSVGGTIYWVILKTAPTRDEFILVTRDSNDDIKVQINASGCWGDGITCGAVKVLTTTTVPTPDSRSFDVEYEANTGRAVIVYSDDTANPKYVTWDGSSWSASASIGNAISTGIVEWIELSGRPNSDEIAVAFSGVLDNLDAMTWNGNSWGCEPSSALATNLPYRNYKKFDVAYEGSSGDLFIASGINNTADGRRHTKPYGSCTYTTATVIAINEIGDWVDISETILGTDTLIISYQDAAVLDTHSWIWSGSADMAVGCSDNSIETTAVSRKEVAAGYLGFSGREGIVVYADLNSRNIDWCTYNAGTNTWTSQTDVTSSPALSGDKANLKIYKSPNENKIMYIFSDQASDLWAKTYDGVSWANTGAVLETSLSSINFQNFDFSFKPPRYRAEVWHNSSEINYSGILNSVNVTLNFTVTEADFYTLWIYDWQNLQWISAGCDSGNVLANIPTKWWCNETLNPSNYISPENTIRVRIFSVADSSQGTLREDYVQYFVGYTSTPSYANISIEHNSSSISENPSLITKINVTSILKTNVSSGIQFNFYIFNFNSGSWESCPPQTSIGTTYGKLECVRTSNPSYYVSNSRIRVRLNSSGGTTTHQMMEDYLVYQISMPTEYRMEVEHNTTGVSFTGTLNNISLLLNFSTTSVDTSTFDFMMYNFNSGSWENCGSFIISDNNWHYEWCNETINPENYLTGGIIRFRLNETAHQNQAQVREDYIQYYVTYTG